MYTTLKTDVLVIGGGGAGFRAAIGAAMGGSHTVLLSKGPIARSGASPMAGADFTLAGSDLCQIDGMVGDRQDTRDKAMNDIITQGWYLNNQNIVEQYLQTAPQCLQELIDWGVQIRHSDQRGVYMSGLGIMDALYKKAKKLGVQMIEDTFLVDLLQDANHISGGVALRIRTGEFVLIQAKAVIVASGGWHKAFNPNVGMRDLSGDGIAAAYRVGAEVGNMEFITFCCNAFLDPPIWRGSIAPYILSILLGGGRFTNRDGEEFLHHYDPFIVKVGTATEWNKSFISCASMKEIRRGKGSPHGGIYYSRGTIPWKIVEKAALKKYPNWHYKAIDFSKWRDKLQANIPVEVGAAAEYFDGGIVVADQFNTAIEGLYAAGECCLGAFGANRVFSAITEMLVQGAAAGTAAAAHVNKMKTMVPFSSDTVQRIIKTVCQPLTRTQGISPIEIKKKMQKDAYSYLGPVRNEKELTLFLHTLKDTFSNILPQMATHNESCIYNQEWIESIEICNLIQLLILSVTSALARTESRGVHYREDYPYTDNDQWLVENIFTKKAESCILSKRPVMKSIMELPTGRMEYFQYMKHLMEMRSNTGGKH